MGGAEVWQPGEVLTSRTCRRSRRGLRHCQNDGVDDRRFDELVRTHSPSLVIFARSLTSDRHAADEAVQDTLVRAWRYLDSFDARGSFEGWLLQICRRVIIDHAAADARRCSTIDSVARVNASPTVDLDTSNDIVELLRQLPAAQTEVLVLTGVLGYTYHDAASMLDVPVGTIRSRVARGRDALAELLSPREADRREHGAA
jgi:RNA polymerase sigma-70 factor, ECF subfamily